MQLWNRLPKKKTGAIIRLYRLAENAGRQAALSAMKKELLSDSTIEAALQSFGWGRRYKKASLITQRAVLRETVRLAAEKMGKQG